MQRRLKSTLILAIGLGLSLGLVRSVNAQDELVSFVERVEIDQRRPLLGGHDFGAGAYEYMEGHVVFAFDPAHPANDSVVDLDLAQRRRDGLVEAVADLVVLRPATPPHGGGTALIEISNRGGKAALRYFCRARGGPESGNLQDFGDGWLLSRGLTLVWLGWQADVPRAPGVLSLRVPVARNPDGTAIRGLVRSDWTVDQDAASLPLAHRNHQAYPALENAFAQLTVRNGREAPREVIASSRWRFVRVNNEGVENAARDWVTLDGGFRAGHIYEMVYTAEDPQVIGLGLAAVRDFAAFMKRSPECTLPVEYTVAVGISQTGRFLRHFLYQGFQTAADGEPAFDAIMALTAGAGRGSFNHRFGQPSRDAHRYSAFFYPTDLFPFTSRRQRDPLDGSIDGLLSKVRADGVMPKLFQVNSGYEYWGRAASLIHTSLEGAADLPPTEDERFYHLRSAQHFAVPWPRVVASPVPNPVQDGAAGPPLFQGSPIDNLSAYRALLATLLDWTESGERPPPSHVPRIGDRTLVPLDEYAWPRTPEIPAPKVVHQAYRAHYGPEWEQGRITLQPPHLGPAFVALVPQVDERGNEIAGVPNLETMVPLGSFVPWNLRPAGADGARELTDFYGSFLPFARDPQQAQLWHDPRPDLSTLYPQGEVSFLHQVEAALEHLQEHRWILPLDVERARAEALRRYRILTEE